MNIDIFKRFPLCLCLAIFLSSCAVKAVPDKSLSVMQAANAAKANTPELCAYKGRIAVKALDGSESMSFNALIDKLCNGDFSATFLGPLNSVIAKMDYIGGNIDVESHNHEIKNHIRLMGRSYALIVKNYMKSPLMLPDKSFSLSYHKDSYVFEKDDNKIYADSSLRLYKYSIDGIEAAYKWGDGFISEADVSQDDSRVIIRFLGGSSWHGMCEVNGQ